MKKIQNVEMKSRLWQIQETEEIKCISSCICEVKNVGLTEIARRMVITETRVTQGWGMLSKDGQV